MSAAQPEKVSTPYFRHLPLTATLSLFVVTDLLIATVIDARSDEAAGIILGITFAQVVLLAVWAALGPSKLLTRTLLGFCGTILVGLILVACIHRGGGGSQQWLFFGIVATQWFGIQIPLWGFRLLFAWRLCWPGERVAAGTRRDTQFGIGQLMVWTAFVAISLGIGRMLVPGNINDLTNDGPEAVAIFAILTVFTCLLAWPVVWATLAPRRWPLWLVVSVCCCLVLTTAEILTFHAVMGRGGDGEVFWIMNGLQAAAATVTLLTMRVSGFHLVRSRSEFAT